MCWGFHENMLNVREKDWSTTVFANITMNCTHKKCSYPNMGALKV